MIQFSKDWFYNKVTVSKFPELASIHAGEFDTYKFRINVSDIYKPEVDEAFLRIGIQNNWFPLGEAFGMPLESIYGALQIMREAERQDRSVLLHCHAGRNRSVLIADCYYFLSTMKHREQDQKGLLYAQNSSNRVMLNVNDGQLPGIYKIEEFLDCCRETFSESFIEKTRPLDWIKHEMHMKGSGFVDQTTTARQ